MNALTDKPDLQSSGIALREGVERALADYLSVDYWHALEAEQREAALDEGLWTLAGELALPELLLSEAAGGAGASLVEAHGALEALGALAVPTPAAEAMIGRWCASRWRLDLGPGRITLAPALPQDVVCVREQADGRFAVQAALRSVPFGRHCKHLLVQASAGSQKLLCAIDLEQPGISITPGSGLNGEARDLVTVDVTLDAASVAAITAGPDLLSAAAAMRAVQMASALASAMDMCTSYVTERKQFGRPLAKFQAIQQQLAVMAALTTNATVAARRAFTALDAADPMVAVAAAKSAVGRACTQGTAIAHQVHGAMGFTAEYGLHRLTRRLWTWREEYGNETWWSQQLGTRVLAAGADSLWDLVIDEPD